MPLETGGATRRESDALRSARPARSGGGQLWPAVRREALKDMSDRLGIPEMTSFVAAIIQSEQLGVSLAKVLRIQADQMRVKRRQYAEEQAHKAPIKMIIPMALLIFPSILIIILTPAILQFMSSGV